ncbi:MAG: TIM barrel protein [Verrucomicrobiota bacterium]
MNRRQFSHSAISSIAALSLCRNLSLAEPVRPQPPFTLSYAPHFGMFAKSAPGGFLEELEFAHAQGFRAWEDNRMPTRDIKDQEAIGQKLSDLGMKMGVVSAKTGIQASNFASRDEEARDLVLEQISSTVEVARRVNAGYITLVSGQLDLRWPREIQFANCIDLLRRAVDLVEPHAITLVMEPLNRFTNHPGSFLETVTEGYLICKAVDHPNCKVLYDMYHQQIAGGNLIPLFDLCRDQIGYVQVGDNPGRKEPRTGEINYRKVFAHLHASGFDGIIGMEHGNSMPGPEGERAVVEAYRSVDPKPEN